MADENTSVHFLKKEVDKATKRKTKQFVICLSFSLETCFFRKYVIHLFLASEPSFQVPKVLVQEDGNIFSFPLRREIG